MNILTEMVIFTILFLLPQHVPVGIVTVDGVAPGSPAAGAGIRPGDQVLAVNGERIRNHLDLIDRVRPMLETSVELNIRRGTIVSGLSQSPEFSVIETVTVVPRLHPPRLRVVETILDPGSEITLRDARRYDGRLKIGDTLKQGVVGIMISTDSVRFVKERQPALQALPSAASQIWWTARTTGGRITSWVSGGPNPSFMDPIGIAQVTGEMAEVANDHGFEIFFEFVAFLSISLGLINILPIPVLDGRKLVFVMVECARTGKRISPKKEGMAHVVGFALIIAVVPVVSFFDVSRILSGGSLLP